VAEVANWEIKKESNVMYAYTCFFLSSSVIIWVREYRGIGTLLRINGSFYEANSLAVNQPLYCTPKLYEDEQQVNEHMRESIFLAMTSIIKSYPRRRLKVVASMVDLMEMEDKIKQ
jgi:hypothetical protein